MKKMRMVVTALAVMAIALPFAAADASSHCANPVKIKSGIFRQGAGSAVQDLGAVGCSSTGADTNWVAPQANRMQVTWGLDDQPLGGSLVFGTTNVNLELCPPPLGQGGQPPCPANTIRWFHTNANGQWFWLSDSITVTTNNAASAVATVCVQDPAFPSDPSKRICSSNTYRPFGS